MKKSIFTNAVVLAIVILVTCFSSLGLYPACAAEAKTLNVLFIGNSYTARHQLSQLVKSMPRLCPCPWWQCTRKPCART
jgi:hypothetical protein